MRPLTLPCLGTAPTPRGQKSLRTRSWTNQSDGLVRGAQEERLRMQATARSEREHTGLAVTASCRPHGCMVPMLPRVIRDVEL